MSCVYSTGSFSHFNVLHLLQEPEADRLQRLPWPLVEPVDRRAVDHSRELPAPIPQFTADRREAQGNLEVMAPNVIGWTPTHK